MASSLSVTTQITNDGKIELTAEITDGTLPKDVFIYENTGDVYLGGYIGVCSLDEYQRLQTFTGIAIPMFGNKYVKSYQAKILLDLDSDITDVIRNITNTLTFLSFSMSNQSSSTQIINIP
jgi:hypothetical protein